MLAKLNILGFCFWALLREQTRKIYKSWAIPIIVNTWILQLQNYKESQFESREEFCRKFIFFLLSINSNTFLLNSIFLFFLFFIIIVKRYNLAINVSWFTQMKSEEHEKIRSVRLNIIHQDKFGIIQNAIEYYSLRRFDHYDWILFVKKILTLQTNFSIWTINFAGLPPSYWMLAKLEVNKSSNFSVKMNLLI